MLGRTTLFYLAIMLNGLACQPTQERSQTFTLQELLNKAEENGLASGKQVDSTFLGFRFGMSISEFEHHYDSLLKENVFIKETTTGKEVFEITSKNGELIKGELTVAFESGKLYKVGLLIEDEVPVISYHHIESLYSEKYNYIKEIPTGDIDLGVSGKAWVKDNLKISILKGITNVTVDYSDIRIERSLSTMDSAKVENEKVKTMQQL
jgi:predicted transcriptional regulator